MSEVTVRGKEKKMDKVKTFVEKNKVWLAWLAGIAVSTVIDTVIQQRRDQKVYRIPKDDSTGWIPKMMAAIPEKGVYGGGVRQGDTIAKLGEYGEWLIEEAAKKGITLSPEDTITGVTTLIMTD